MPYLGGRLTVNTAARIMGHAEGGETLVSESVRSATLGSGLDFDDAGAVQFKGIPEPFTLHRWLRRNSDPSRVDHHARHTSR